MINKENLIWDSSIEEIKKGYVENSNEITCIICGKTFIKGEIYSIGDNLYDAEKAAKLHIEGDHNSTLDYLLHMNSSFTGISEVQREVVSLFAQNISDKDIAAKLGVSPSTIRNHRYKLREKEKQARIFLALMELLSENTHKKISTLDTSVLCDAHKSATTIDDRFNISDEEKRKILNTYMDEAGALKSYPTKEKRKIIVLEAIAKNFSPKKKYSEKEVNTLLKRIYEDYVALRRALIEYGFLERTKNGSSYWIKL